MTPELCCCLCFYFFPFSSLISCQRAFAYLKVTKAVSKCICVRFCHPHCVYENVTFYNKSSSLLFSFLLILSPHSAAGGAGWPEWQNPEDHRLWSGQRVAPDHQDECSRDLRLDGPGGHQALPLLQEQRRVEVLPLPLCVSLHFPGLHIDRCLHAACQGRRTGNRVNNQNTIKAVSGLSGKVASAQRLQQDNDPKHTARVIKTSDDLQQTV